MESWRQSYIDNKKERLTQNLIYLESSELTDLETISPDYKESRILRIKNELLNLSEYENRHSSSIQINENIT